MSHAMAFFVASIVFVLLAAILDDWKRGTTTAVILGIIAFCCLIASMCAVTP